MAMCFGASKNSIIKSADDRQKVDLTGTWKATGRDGVYYKMIFGEDGSFTYGCGSDRGPEQLSFSSNGSIKAYREFNGWWIKEAYKTSGNILIATYDEVKDYYNVSKLREGTTVNFVVSIIDENELVIQTAGTGAVRTYKRK
ncbi:hypothetical protein [Treponema pectinovorum]|uniref:hypothetical protein n=1 Tax=Treponema pectinovorum TaxID=164 RepID=UPI0011C8269D|nr:hypothetical protein [Treponema pectinovorum]